MTVAAEPISLSYRSAELSLLLPGMMFGRPSIKNFLRHFPAGVTFRVVVTHLLAESYSSSVDSLNKKTKKNLMSTRLEEEAPSLTLARLSPGNYATLRSVISRWRKQRQQQIWSPGFYLIRRDMMDNAATFSDGLKYRCVGPAAAASADDGLKREIYSRWRS